jgi:hypothetical protein
LSNWLEVVMTLSHCCLVCRAGSFALAAIAGFCLLAVTACRDEAISAANWDGAVRDSAGIEIVENFGTPLWREGESWKFTEVVRIGVIEGDPEYEFGRITGIAVLSDRRIVVADAMAHQLRYFSPDGVHELTMGRAGQGPGEFGRGILLPFVGPGDTLVVLDFGNQQAHLIAPDGTWVESYSVLPHEGHDLVLLRDEPTTGRLATLDAPVRQSDGSLTDTLDILVERDLRGAALDTLVRMPTYRLSETLGGPTPYFIEAVDICLCQDAVVIGHNYQHRSVWYGSGGKIERIITLPWSPLPFTEEDRSVMLGRYDQLFRQNNVPADRAAEVKSSIQFTDDYPAYTQFRCGPAGTFLVQRVRPHSQLNEEERSRIRTNLARPPGGLEWDVFDSDGRYLGMQEIPGTEWVASVVNPRFVRDPATGAWYVYSVWSDEQDVQYVVGWRVEGPLLD